MTAESTTTSQGLSVYKKRLNTIYQNPVLLQTNKGYLSCDILRGMRNKAVILIHVVYKVLVERLGYFSGVLGDVWFNLWGKHKKNTCIQGELMKAKRKKTKVLSFRVDEEMYQRVRAEAMRDNVTADSIIKKMLGEGDILREEVKRLQGKLAVNSRQRKKSNS